VSVSAEPAAAPWRPRRPVDRATPALGAPRGAPASPGPARGSHATEAAARDGSASPAPAAARHTLPRPAPDSGGTGGPRPEHRPNFDNADIETVIQAASEIVGFNYVLAPDVRGKVTVQTAGRIPQEDVMGVLLAILEVHGFTAVKSGNLYKMVRIVGARERAVPTIVGTSVDSGRPDDEVITQIISVSYASAVDLTTLLRPMISARGPAATETNVLIMDTSANIRGSRHADRRKSPSRLQRRPGPPS
jgi:hypothetical protein